MSVKMKCKYSAKFWPLVHQMQTTVNDAEFKVFLYDNFEDADVIYSEFREGVSYTALSDTIFNPKQIDDVTGTVKFEENAEISTHYIGREVARQRMLRRFKTNIIALSVYNLTENTGTWVDANAVEANGKTKLNNNLVNHKLQLINQIRNYISEADISNISDLTPEQFTKLLNDTTSSFAQKSSNPGLIKNFEYLNSLDAYVTLKNYNQLLSENVPFIEVKVEYSNTSLSGTDMYTYVGPNVQHFTHWGDNKEVDVSTLVSDLSKILLDYFPEINDDHSIKESSSITISGFNSSMTSMVSEIFYSSDIELSKVRDELFKGAQMNVSLLINEYLNYLSKLDGDVKRVKYLRGKLRGINKYIYNSNLPTELKDMFTAMILKTVPVSYMSYGYKTNKGVVSRNLKEQLVNNQSRRLNDVVKASSYTLQHNVDKFTALKEAYGITIDGRAIRFTQATPHGEKSFSIIYTPKTNKTTKRNDIYKFEIEGEINDVSLQALVYDVLGIVISEDFGLIGAELHPEKAKWTSAKAFAPLLAITLLSANGDTNFTKDSMGMIELNYYVNDFLDVSTINTIVYGSDSVNVIKNAEGNNLPLYQLISLAYKFPHIRNKHINAKKEFEKIHDYSRENILSDNFLISTNIVGAPIVRSTIDVNGKIKKPSSLTFSEVTKMGILYDFYENFISTEKDEKAIYFQNTAFADKDTHYLIKYDILKGFNYNGMETNLYRIINDSLNNKDTSALQKMFYKSRNSKINKLVQNILDDFSIVFNTEFATLENVEEYIKNNKISLDKLTTKFTDVGVDLIENIHYSKSKTGLGVNETIKHWFKIFNSEELTKKRLDNNRRRFIKDLFDENFKISLTNDELSKSIKDNFGNYWLDGDKIVLARINGKPVTDPALLLDPQYNVVLHPMLETYFMTDVFLSNEYNSIMIGEVYAHANKNKDGNNEEEYANFSEASRLNAQYKRAVILGATHHPFLQNMKNGVANKIKIAVISDDVAEVLNMVGDIKDDLEIMDGGGWSSPYQTILENNSLLDASVGIDRKTIMHDINPMYGNATLLKWAVYSLSNERRKLSLGSTISGEQMFKKMHSLSLNKIFDLNKYYNALTDNELFFKDYRTGKYFAVSGFEQEVIDGKMIVKRFVYEVDSLGNDIDLSNGKDESFQINSLYDLDQLFGGAFAMQKSIEGDRLISSNHNIDIVSKIIIGEDLRNNFVGYVVNKSAIKVGAANINSSNKFKNDEEFYTFDMSSEYGGVQMDADHDLDTSEVTEMSQMISSLVQNGYTQDYVDSIYKDIGKVVSQSLKNFETAILEQDRQKLYTLLGEALVESFAQGNKDTLGLAQSFVTLASQSLQKNSLEYKLPFSAATISGAFISTVTSTINKKGIKRKYPGMGGVQVPSYSMIQYYSLRDKLGIIRNYNFDSASDLVLDKGVENDIDPITGQITRTAWEKATQDIIFNEGFDQEGRRSILLNPFLERINDRGKIDWEDTIVVWERSATDPEKEFTVIRVDNFDKYEEVKHRITSPTAQFYNWTIKPKGLKGLNTKFEIETITLNGNTLRNTFSIYDLDTVRAALYLTKGKLDDYAKSIIEKAYGKSISNVDKRIILNDLRIKTQNILNNLSEGRPIPTSLAFNTLELEVLPINVQVEPADIVMGRLNAQKLGLQEGDSINDIEQQGADFFYKRMSKNYITPNVDRDLYDVTLYTKRNKKVLIKVLQNLNEYPVDNLSREGGFKIVDNQVYYDGIYLSEEGDKQFFTYTNDNGEQFDLIVLKSFDQLTELRKSQLFDTYRYNYTSENWREIAEHQYWKDLQHGDNIWIDFRDVTTGEIKKRPISIMGFDGHQELLNAEVLSFEQRLKGLSHHKFDSFQKQLNFISARIPSQSMQSFMPMKVALYTDSEVNDVHISKYATWLAGSDFDIDKLYIMGYALDDNGGFQTESQLQKDFPVDEVMKLPTPNGIRYSESEDGIIISLQELQQIVGTFDSIMGVPSTPSSIDPFIKILNSDINTIKFIEPVEVITNKRVNRAASNSAEREFNNKKREFLRLLNKHSLSKISDFAREQALKNNVVDKIFKVILDPKNQINLHIPINMEEQQRAASNSDLGNKEKYMSFDNPSSKFIMQVQNMTGKKVIGNVAVALKVYFGVSHYFNREYAKIPSLLEQGQTYQVLETLNNLIFTNPITNDLGIIANVNLTKAIDYIIQSGKTILNFPQNVEINESYKKYTQNGQLRLLDLFLKLQEISNNTEAALSISGLLSAATDNAKELILAKINATENFVGIYNYRMTIGDSFDDIAKDMMTPVFNQIVKLTNSNVFDSNTQGFNLNSAINFYLNRDSLPFLSQDILKFIGTESVFEKLSTNKGVSEIASIVNTKLASFSSSEYDDTSYEGYEDDYYFEEYSDYSDEFDTYEEFTKSNRNFETNPITYTEYKKILDFLDYVKRRNSFIESMDKKAWEKQKTYLELLSDKIIPATEEMNILGRIFGANQGFKTNGNDKYSYIRNIETFVNRRFSKKNAENKRNASWTKLETFDLMRFFKDSAYQELMINQYERLKSTYNVLDVAVTVPHFAAMFKLVELDDSLITIPSVRETLVREIASKVVANDTIKMNKLEYKELTKYVGDILIVNFLFGSELKVNVPPGQKYYDKLDDHMAINDTNMPISVSLDNLRGIATFKNLMEEYIIPTLKKGIGDDGNVDPALESNTFIMSLSQGIIGDKLSNGIKLYHRLPLNMLQIDASQKTQIIYGRMLEDFNNLANKTFNGHRIVDLFYLYNLVTNKDNFGPNSLTRIFEDMATSGNASLLVNRFNNWLSELDYKEDKSIIKYDLRDLKHKLSKYPNATYRFGTSETVNEQYDPSNFTFNMTYLTNDAITLVKDIIRPIEDDDKSYFKQIFQNREVIFALADKFLSNYNGNVEIITDDDVAQETDELVRNAKAYIENGTVKLNIDKADITSPLHEYAHIVMAALKSKHPDIYYKLLSDITQHPKFEEISILPIYNSLHGSDLKEEVFITLMSTYFKNRIYEWEGNEEILNSQDVIKNMVEEIFEIDTENSDLQDLMATSVENVIKVFNSKLFTYEFNSLIDVDLVKTNQKLANLKDNLIKNDIIKKDCE